MQIRFTQRAKPSRTARRTLSLADLRSSFYVSSKSPDGLATAMSIVERRLGGSSSRMLLTLCRSFGTCELPSRSAPAATSRSVSATLSRAIPVHRRARVRKPLECESIRHLTAASQTKHLVDDVAAIDTDSVQQEYFLPTLELRAQRVRAGNIHLCIRRFES